MNPRNLVLAATLATLGGSARAEIQVGAVAAASSAERGPTLQAERILCGEQFRPDPRSKLAPAAQCVATARAFFDEEWRPQVLAILAGSPAGLEAIRPADTFELPDGTLIPGSALPAHVPTLFGSNMAGLIAISNDFTIKPIDRDTVLLFGVPKFTVKGRDGTTYSLTSAQLSVYRRTRPGVTRRGWEQLGEFWTYQTENRGPKPGAAVAPAQAPRGQ